MARTIPPHSADVEAGRLRLFAKATGETRAEYLDEDAARAAGHPALLGAADLRALPRPRASPIRSRGSSTWASIIARVLHGGERVPLLRADLCRRPAHVGRASPTSCRRRAAARPSSSRTPTSPIRHGVKVAEMRATIVVRRPDRSDIRCRSMNPYRSPSTPSTSATRCRRSRCRRSRARRSRSSPARRATTIPIHIDSDFARAAGMPDVFAHGMLSMAWLGRLLTNWAPQRDLREFGVRFTAMTRVGEAIVCTGRRHRQARARRRAAGAGRGRRRRTTSGEVKVAGDALIALR